MVLLRLSLFYTFLLLTHILAAAEKNVVFYIADDLGQDLGCYGNPAIKTPHIDQLARDGVIFTNAYATTASCSASRSVIMTGLHNHANGHYGHAHDTGHFSCYHNTVALALPQVMRKAGYRTALIGKHHVAPEYIFHYDLMLPPKGRNAIATVEQARPFIFDRQDDRPFLLYIGQIDPHRSNKELEIPHRPNAFGNLPNRKSFPNTKEHFYEPHDVNVPSFLPDTPETRAELAQYYQSASRFDAGLGKLIELLKEAGVYDKTMIIVTSDHGMAFPGAKTTVSEPGLKVPFIVRNPYLKKRGHVNRALISHTDVTPSILDYAGGLDRAKNAPKQPVDPQEFMKAMGGYPSANLGPKFETYHGRSWLPILETEDDIDRDVLYASHTFHEVQMYYPMRVIRDRQFKLIWNIAYALTFPFSTDLWSSATWQAQIKKGEQAPFGTKTVGEYLHRPEFELYDLLSDPHETRNLAKSPEFQETLAKMKTKLKEFQIHHKDPWVLKWEYQ